MRSRRHWIPPFALMFAHLAHGFSWALVFCAAWTGNFENPLFGFAWIHTIALAWISTAAFAILLHALPNFIDVQWPAQPFARACIAAVAAGAVLLIWGFLALPALLAPAAAVLLCAIVSYLATAFATVGRGMRSEDRIDRAVARAFGVTFAFLAAAAFAGAYMAIAQRFAIAPAHAHLATLGWLSLLIFGVSMRTLKPIAQSGGSSMRWLHIVVGTFGALGALLLAVGVNRIGGACFAIAAIGYAIDVADILRRAKNPHRPPQAFVAASITWLLCAMALGAGVLMGERWQSAYIFVLLIGWAGQMVNGHLHHIGIRLLATIYRGDDDETPPGDLLETRLSWYAFATFQLAIAAIVAALLQDRAALAARGAIFGLTAWIAMTANVLVARYRASARSRLSSV